VVGDYAPVVGDRARLGKIFPSATTCMYFIKYCSSCFSFFNPSHPSLHRIHTYSNFPMCYEQMFDDSKSSSYLLEPITVTAHHFNDIPASAIVESTVVLPSVE
jgi:hypothetical protein